MPKQKTHRGSAKRFKRTGGGGLKNVLKPSQATAFHGKTKNNVVTCVNKHGSRYRHQTY